MDASVVLAPYLEPVVRGRRVAVLGDASGPVGPALLERGARLVHVYDPAPARAAEAAARVAASRSLVFAPLPEGELAVRDGAFDTVIVPDLSIFPAADGIVARARRLASAHGVAVFGCPNPDTIAALPGLPKSKLLTYYELYDVVALQFPEVRMLGQAPFAGYVIADFAPDGEPDVVVDTSLLERGAEEPSWFVALGTNQPRRLDAYTIVQVPRDVFAVELGGAGVRQPTSSASQTQVEELQRDLKSSRARVEELLEQQANQAPAFDTRVRELEEAIRKAEGRAGDNHVRAGQLESKVRDLDEELVRQRDRAFRLSNELEEEKKRHTKAALELGMVRRSSELPRKQEPSPELQEQLKQLRETTQQLEANVADRDRRVAELEAELGAAQARVRALEAHEARVRQLQTDLEVLNDEVTDLRAAAKQADISVVELKRRLREREDRIDDLDATVVQLQTEAERHDDALEQRLETLQRELKTARAKLQHARRDHERDVDQLEQRLLDRGRQITALQDELHQREVMVRELVLRLDEALAGQGHAVGSAEAPGEGALQRQVHELAAQCAHREAALQRSSWRVQELERLVAELEGAQQQGAAPRQAELEHALVASQSELDALRRALREERAQRLRAEGAAQEASAQEQADLQEQVVLLEAHREPEEPGEGAG